MALHDWKYEAEQYRELDQAILAKIEAEDALLYFHLRGRWPEGLSVRAWEYAKEHFPSVTPNPPPALHRSRTRAAGELDLNLNGGKNEFILGRHHC